MFNVYVPNHYRDKGKCWETLSNHIMEGDSNNTIVGGDFNLILHANEKRGGNFLPDPFRNQMENVMHIGDLIDIAPKNRKFTWSNRRLGSNNIMERLDRFLVNISLVSTFSSVNSTILPFAASNHYPITLDLNTHCALGPLPFKYNQIWSDQQATRNIIQLTWRQHIEGSPSFIWESKLKNVQRALRQWAKSYYKEPEQEKHELKHQIAELQCTIEQKDYCHSKKFQEEELYNKLRKIKRQVEEKWRTKSRQVWLESGDKNTSFFHKQATARQVRNTITAITDNAGTHHVEQADIKEAAAEHFKDLLTEVQEEESYDDLLHHLHPKVTDDLNKILTAEIKEEEIVEAIWNLHPNKAPGPDGFPISFYRDYWELIKKYLIKYIKWIKKRGKIGGYTNATHLALIPKENRPSNFSRFRPISLCNSSYKIFTKIIASRLKPLLPMLISDNQGGFMENRQILDSILLVQEAIHSSHARNEKGFILKLDLVNAFDRVRHSFLFAVLQRMGFSPLLINVIRCCIFGPLITPLINGRPGPSFQTSRGLRQGCPLSPYLFILMAESFSCALDQKRQSGLITGIKFEDGIKNINHSQFADDTLLLGGATTIIARRFKSLLDKFMRYSGGKINYLKSCIYGWNVSPQMIHNISNTFGVPCKLDWDCFSYLGMPVTIGKEKTGVWDLTLDKMKRKLQRWGTLWLNPAGRQVLLKSGLSCLPLYQFSLAHAPASFHRKMDSILRFFLWQGSKNEKKKFNVVNWKQVIQSPENGGLGIRSPSIMNLAFGGKLIWRLMDNQPAWWKNVLESKYLNQPRSQILNAEIPNRHCTKIWKFCKKSIVFMVQNVSKVPKGGETVNIGSDKIMGNPPINSLPDIDPILRYLHSKGISNLSQISQWNDSANARVQWEFPPIPHHLKGSFGSLCSSLHSIAPTIKGAKDEFRWDPSGTNYSIKAGYSYLSSKEFPTAVWAHRKILKTAEAIPKINFFMWTLLHGKILTAENLRKRGIFGPSSLIFRDKATTTRHIILKATSLASETIASKLTKRINPVSLWTEERNFIWNLIDRSNTISATKIHKFSGKYDNLEWKICLTKDDFGKWLLSKNTHSLFFDGASKSNLGAAGAGGIILDPSGATVSYFEWGLGRLSNNRAEALDLFQGLLQLQNQGINKALVFGDSAIIVSLMNSNRQASNLFLHQIISRCKNMLSQNMECQFFHVLRSNNQEADKKASHACSREKGSLLCNQASLLQFIP
eukprot:PITA_17214